MPAPGGGIGAMSISRWLQGRQLPSGGIQQVCAVALAATGTFALASLIPFLAAGRPSTAPFPLNVLFGPAWFLYDSFLWFGLLIPVLCYVYVFVLYNDRVTREVMASLVAVGLFLPVLGTLSHVLLAEDGAFAAVALVEAFGRVPAAILLILILILESVAFFALLKHWREWARRTAAERPRQDDAAPALAAAGGETAPEPRLAGEGLLHLANGAAEPYANGAAHAHANGTAPPPANGATPPPAGGTGPSYAGGAGPPHTGGTIPPPADGTTPPYTGGTVSPPDDRATPLPAGGTAPPQSYGASPPPANGAAPPYANGTTPPPHTDSAAPPHGNGATPPHTGGTVPPHVVGGAPPPAAGNGHAGEPEFAAEGSVETGHRDPMIVDGQPPAAAHALAGDPEADQPGSAEPEAPAVPGLDLPLLDGADGEPNPVAYADAAGDEAQPSSDPAAKPGARPRSRRRAYSVPLEILDEHESDEPWQVENDTREAAATLMATLAEFRIDAEVTGVRRGPVITMFEILPAPGVKISRIVNLADNIALRLAASRVRIVAPIPGKHAVGIEVPNKHRAIVGFRDLISKKEFRPKPRSLVDGVPIALGKDITGETQVIDITATPHLLIAGATGAGKSVLVNTLICSILYSRTPEQVRLLLIDPKIVELKLYNDVPHLLTPVITDPKRAFQALQYCLYEMERRYALLDNLGVRDIRSYNRKLTERDDQLTLGPLPFLVIVIDEFADLMATTGKELEATLARLAAMARAVGIHIVLATQRPSIDVITGLIKANIPSRIAFMVASKFDSRIIIDAVGAEKLLGRGDMLFVPAWDANPLRIQGALVSEEEVERVTEKVRELGEPDYIDEDILFDDEEAELVLEPGGGDPMMDQALEIVAGAGKASASYLQRKLKIGYNRAARLVEEMEQRGIVGPANGSKPREILHLPNRDKS